MNVVIEKNSSERAMLAGGCFWGMEEIVRKIPGVLAVRVGYSGGHIPNPTYAMVSAGRSGHAEVIEVSFNPSILSFHDLLGFFFRMHDPTTPNRQGNDIGTQYRSAIFYFNEDQQRVALQAKDEAERSGRWSAPLVTEIVRAGEFYQAEEYHQDYLQKHPGGYSCHYLRE